MNVKTYQIEPELLWASAQQYAKERSTREPEHLIMIWCDDDGRVYVRSETEGDPGATVYQKWQAGQLIWELDQRES